MTLNHADPHELNDLISEARLHTTAGDRAFARGVAYFEAGAVTDLVVSDETINARVVGGDEYAVQIWNDDGELGYSCTCPVGDDGVFCKHGVAAGLAWLADRTEAGSATQGRSSPYLPGQKASVPARRHRDDLAGIREWLTSAPRERLEELLLEQAQGDPALRNRLGTQAARAAAAGHIDIKSLMETVGKVLSVSGFVDYHATRRFIERARPAADLISGLIEDGHANTARELARYALKRGIAAYERIDDSDGGFGELLHEIAKSHLKACRAAPPELAAFGKSLFELQMLDDRGLVSFDDYAPLLGDAGLKAFRALAEKEWEKVPARGPADREARSATSYFRITSIMEGLARQATDVDALVAIKSRDLTLPYHFLAIAQILAEAGRRDEALSWAERGHRTFPDRPDSRLIQFLTDEYGRRGRHEEALALAWEQFSHRPAFGAYQHLHNVAKRAGTWDEWRAKALAWLREDLVKSQKHDRNRGSWTPGRHSLLVEIFLWEDDSDAALAEAKSGGCTQDLWFALARAREKDHPADAAEIYRNRLDGIVERKNNRAYDEAAALVQKIRDLMERTKQEKEFVAWVDAVRAKHKAKRNFMQRLNEML